MSGKRDADIDRFYELFRLLASVAGQLKPLSFLSAQKNLPNRGVYFFCEEGERRRDEPRVVRVGTHGVSAGSKSTLRARLSAHRGSSTGSGNHRGSIFRLHVGRALLAKEFRLIPTWGVGSVVPAELRLDPSGLADEAHWEKRVSAIIGAMPVCWVAEEDEASAASMRGFIERNAIALLSNRGTSSNPPSSTWLGLQSPRLEIASSGLWNLKHIDEHHDAKFLDVFERAVLDTVARG